TARAVRLGERSADALANLTFFIVDALEVRAATLTTQVYLGDPAFPIGGVFVRAVDPNTGAAGFGVTGADGTVRFAALPPGTYVFTVLDYLPTDPALSVVVPPTGTATVGLSLARGARIVGRVVGSDGFDPASEPDTAVVAALAGGATFRG